MADPVLGCFFSVNMSCNAFGWQGEFYRVSGLGSEFEFESYREGGSNYPEYFFKAFVPQVLTLEYGLITSRDGFAIWMTMANYGMFIPLVGTIVLMDAQGKKQRTWTVVDAFVTKYIGPDLDASRGQIAVSRVELVHNGVS